MGLADYGCEYSFSVNGTTLTITRTAADDDDDEAWDDEFRLRSYLPTEDIPDFTSTVFTYYCLNGKWVPKDATEVNIHPSVHTIKQYTFVGCSSLVRVTIPDTVTHIDNQAFMRCSSLRIIRLPPNLVTIGYGLSSSNRHTHR